MYFHLISSGYTIYYRFPFLQYDLETAVTYRYENISSPCRISGKFNEQRVAFVDLKSVSWDPKPRGRLYKGCHAGRIAAFDYGGFY